MINYKGYRIGSTCGKSPLWFIQSMYKGSWTDLFFGIESLDKAKSAIDNWMIACETL